MKEKKVYLTKEGLGALEVELKELVSIRRKEVAKRIAEAKEYGDLSENAEYTEAKNEQAWLEGRVQELELMIKNASIIGKGEADKVSIGTTVVVEIEGEAEEYTIVGAAEADPLEHKISNESPIGRALLSRGVGEIVEVEAPAGLMKFKISQIK
jgi:transcription elongation factor GreA